MLECAADVAGLVRFCRTCSQIISASKLEDSRYAVRCLSRKPNAADLQGLVIAKSPDRAWHANIERHFDKNLTPFTAEYRAFRISLEHTAPLGFVCELCGERRSGEELRVKVLHDDDALYFGIRAHDTDPRAIVDRLARRPCAVVNRACGIQCVRRERA